MTDVVGAYCATEDLRLGDINPFAPKDQYVKNAAEEIDAALGHIYVTPIVIPNEPEFRPSRLTLKKINYLLASGRAILDMAASGENQNQHAYGMGMLKEGLAMLAQLSEAEAQLPGAPVIELPEGQETPYTGPTIFNEDPESLVKGFYQRGQQGLPYPPSAMPQPYGIPVRLI